MLFRYLTRSLLIAGSLSVAKAQCLNEVAAYNPNIRTQTSNSTYFLVPVPKTAAQQALDYIYGYNNVTGGSNVQLSALPTTDTTLFPTGFPTDKHPVLAIAGYDDDIRMAAFQIDGALLSGQVYVPFVRRFDSQSTTVLTAELNGYLTGDGNNPVAGLVPSMVSTLVEGFSTRLGQLTPNSAAYQMNNGLFGNKVAWNVVPNPVTGPGVYVESHDMSYVSAQSLSSTTPKLFKAMLNQPTILTGVIGTLSGNLCQRNQIYFNNASSTIFPRTGNVTFGPAADGIAPQTTGTLQKSGQDGVGIFSNLEGFSACGQRVGFNPEQCDSASKNVDQSAL